MTNHLWLVWYRAQSPMGPKHWSLFVTYDTDEEALGTIYQVRSAVRRVAAPHAELRAQIEGDVRVDAVWAAAASVAQGVRR